MKLLIYLISPATASATATVLRLHPGRQFYTAYNRCLAIKINFILFYIRRKPTKQQAIHNTKLSSRHVTGGVYRVLEHIHRAVMIRDY